MKEGWKLLDVATLDFEDKKTWDMISSGHTDAVFQLESAGMKDVCKRIQPHDMEALCAILALYRPDSMGDLEHYINRKNGTEKIEYVHPDLIPILENTYGCCIYQEQTMKISRVFAGFSFAESDDLRKGLGKKDKSIVKAQAQKFYKRALENGYPEKVCKQLMEEMENKGGYSFNRSHSYSYAVTAYKTAYLQANYDVFFLCALLNSNKGSYSDLSKYINLCKQKDVSVEEPDINNSHDDFSIANGKILFGLAMIKNVGDANVEEFAKCRPFTSFEDFLEKCTPDTRTVASLIKAGCFNNLFKDKIKLLNIYCKHLYSPNQYKEASSLPTKKKMFELKLIQDEIDFKNKELCLLRYNNYRKNKYDENEATRYEKHSSEFKEKYLKGSLEDFEMETLSMYLTTNPYGDLKDILIPLDEMDFGDVVIAGTIIEIQKKTDRNSKKYAYVSLVNHEGIIVEAVAWSSIYSRYQDVLKKGIKIIAKCKKKDNGISLDDIETLGEWKEKIKAREQITNIKKGLL